jgi:hypothetical protein
MIMKTILATTLLVAAVPTTDEIPKVAPVIRPLVLNIAKEYKVPVPKVQEIFDTISKCIDDKFPCETDVLAIIAIESSFQEKAISSAKAKGYMQILYTKTHTVEENIKAGVWLLKDYHRRLGSIEAAVQAYNVGLGNYRKGMRNRKYYDKYVKAKLKLENVKT